MLHYVWDLNFCPSHNETDALTTREARQFSVGFISVGFTTGYNTKLFENFFYWYIDCWFKITKMSKSFLENIPGHSCSHLVTSQNGLQSFTLNVDSKSLKLEKVFLKIYLVTAGHS